MKKLILAFVIATFTLVSFAPGDALAARPIYDVHNTPIYTGDGQSASLEDVQAAIEAAVRKRKWTTTRVGEGHIQAWILVRGKHYAKVDIKFTNRSYSIIYNSSRDLNYSAKRRVIHRNYNNWVKLLERDINKALSKL